MVVTRWEPLKDLMALQERMNKLFDETFSRGTEDVEAGAWLPAADIMEKGDEIILKMEIPEVDQKAIDIKVEGNDLTIKGERKLEERVPRERIATGSNALMDGLAALSVFPLPLTTRR